MFDFDAMIRAAAANIRDPKPTIAFPYDIPQRILMDLADAGVIGGWIADSREQALASHGAKGWWTNRSRPDLEIGKNSSKTLALMGVEPSWRLSRGLLAKSWRAGVRRLVAADNAGRIVEDVSGADLVKALTDRLFQPGDRPTADFTACYDMFFRALGDEMRAPPESFEPDRILILIGSLGPGGAERQASYLASEIARRGVHKVELACYNLSPPGDFFRPEALAAGVRVVEIKPTDIDRLSPAARDALKEAEERFSAIGGPSLLYVVLQLCEAIKESRAATVHTWMDYNNVLGGIAATLAGAPRLVMSGRSVSPESFQIFQPYMRPGYAAVFARRKTVLLNNSDAGARDYERWLGLPARSIATVRNGFEQPLIDRAKARRESREARGWTDTTKVVGSVLRFSEEKRPDYLVDVAIRILESRQDIRFAFFGDGPMRAKLLDRVASVGLSDKILLPGATRQAMAEIAGFDVFVLASRMEGLPNVLVEAQLMGAPVVCTGVGGMGETIVEGATGLVASGDSPAAFADVLLGLLDDSERLRRMSAAALEHSGQRFSIARMVDETMNVYGSADVEATA